MSTPIDRDRDDARRRADEQAADHVHDESVTTGHRSPDLDAGRGSDEPTAVYTPPPVDDRTTSGRADDTYVDQRRADDARADDRRADARGVTDDTTVVEPAPVASAAVAREEVVAREKEEFGGMKFGSAFFGWLTAMGMTVLLTALVAGAGAALGLGAQMDPEEAMQENAETIGIAGAIAVAVILLISYYCGGYVAGRMARFSGAKQGVAVWLWAVIVAIVVAIITAIAGAQWNILANVNTFPRLPFNEGELTTAGIITAVAALVISLLGAILGGLAGMRYHRRVDRAGFGR
ncbi:hypothetical protein [Microbacterium stercoris]|uniref:hypothetical protein n=1 Tax=Microbacterium stercoris TaxID=2820289 RepID=UPI001F16BE64|nr:hypothetical protein [Microbacterium stercoris]